MPTPARKNVAFFLIALLLFTTISCNQPQNMANDTIQESSKISTRDISSERLNSSLILAGQWLLNNQPPDGSINYLYFPQYHNYSTANNMIRQFMATVALAELYKYTGSESFKISYDANMRSNFAHYYVQDGNLGYIAYGNEANLGAASIAVMATLHSEKYANEQQHLTRIILELHNESNGKFRTFYFPQSRDTSNRYFYPGEAMLALMKLYSATKNPLYLDTVKQSFDYYSAYFNDKMNPALVPWHTMADYYLYLETGNETYADYILSINDWLLTIQNKDCSDPRHLGRFYDPNHDDYGPPHASSDGVYVEGLSYAYKIAALRNDTQRMNNYREGMLLGARTLLEMQFSTEESIQRPDTAAVLGGFRTSTDREEIRVDNTQHAVMAFLGILGTLSDEEIVSFASLADYGCSQQLKSNRPATN